ncbi:hypothetical protein ACFW9D_05510 [Streptomyces sp. NPDC059524]|uniref:hypothetical protein n=1 Tax=Streptomyces sp. NPDC059524 TaxID=3346856 RepID=UPI003679F358
MSAQGNHDSLQADLKAIHQDLLGVAQELAETMKEIGDHGSHFVDFAKMIAAKRVDRNTVSETEQVAEGLGNAQSEIRQSISYMSDSCKVVQSALRQLKTTHDGVQEAFQRSPVDQRELAQVDPDWITPN